MCILQKGVDIGGWAVAPLRILLSWHWKSRARDLHLKYVLIIISIIISYYILYYYYDLFSCSERLDISLVSRFSPPSLRALSRLWLSNGGGWVGQPPF